MSYTVHGEFPRKFCHTISVYISKPPLFAKGFQRQVLLYQKSLDCLGWQC